MTRFHDLDALRSVAMLLGIVLHAAAFLIPIDFWPVHEAYANDTPLVANVYAWLASAIHGFRMPLFFLISGFFTAMLWQARGLDRLLRHRLKRIGLPLLAGMFTIVPLVAWASFGSEFSLAAWPFAWLGGLAHLWFLWHILLLAGALVVVAKLGLRFRHSLWWLLIPLAFAPQYFMHEVVFGTDTADGVIPAARVIGYYAVFFAFGVFFFQRGMQVRRWWAVALMPALLLAFPVGMLLMENPIRESYAPWQWGAAAAAQLVYAWLMCFGSMGLFRWIASGERFWVRYLSDSSYWLYLAHLPLVVALQQVLAPLAMGPHLKFVLICTVVVASLLLVYQAGVRYTVIGNILNGPRTRRGTPPIPPMVPRPQPRT